MSKASTINAGLRRPYYVAERIAGRVGEPLVEMVSRGQLRDRGWSDRDIARLPFDRHNGRYYYRVDDVQRAEKRRSRAKRVLLVTHEQLVERGWPAGMVPEFMWRWPNGVYRTTRTKLYFSSWVAKVEAMPEFNYLVRVFEEDAGQFRATRILMEAAGVWPDCRWSWDGS